MRLLFMLPTWLGDAVMATPVLAAARRAFPGAFFGALARPGVDQLFASAVGGGSRAGGGTAGSTNESWFDEIHVGRSEGIMGPKRLASKVRPRGYDAVFLFPSSLSSAVVARLAGIPRRIGYEKEGRGLLLTRGVPRPRRHDGGRLVVSLTDFYWNLAARTLLEGATPDGPRRENLREDELIPLPGGVYLELPLTAGEVAGAAEVLARAGVGERERFVVLQPGANSEGKRWPAERFGLVARHLVERHGVKVLVSGSPAERELAERVESQARCGGVVALPRHGLSVMSLKGVIARAALMVSNDTGPRHMAAALGVPLVTMFGPSDYRWAAIPTKAGETVLRADPTLPESEVANDHPERCAITRIAVDSVIGAVDAALGRVGGGVGVC